MGIWQPFHFRFVLAARAGASVPVGAIPVGAIPVGAALIGAALAGALLPSSPVAASTLDEIVVTGVRPASLGELPRSISVITADDIALAPSTTLVDLLAREANLNLRSYTGNDKFAGIDMRGMGDTFVSNVIVLVDGVRLNSPDLAGADLGSVALDQIERIEIVRGANAVRYGSGAVGGVINIITRAGRPSEPSGAVRASYGSFDTLDAALKLATGGERLSGSAQLAWHDADGYRDNGDLRRLDISLAGEAQLSAALKADASIHVHEDEYGLPGPVSPEAFAGSASDRRATAWPDDGGETRDNRYRARLMAALPAGQALEFGANLRDRRNTFITGFTPLLDREEQESEINEDSAGFELIWNLPLEAGPGRNDFTFGLTGGTTEYSRHEDGRGIVNRSHAVVGEFDDIGLFVATTWTLGDRLQIHAGQRWNATDFESSRQSLREVCDYETVPGIPIPIPVNCRPEQITDGERDERWKNRATDLGAVWELASPLRIFVNFSRAYRVPNVDELALASPDLRPQDSRHFDAGLRLQAGERLELSLTGFRSDTDDEIVYMMDPDTLEGLNLNAAGTVERKGFELEARWGVLPTLTVLGNAGYTRATFADSRNDFPLVPRWTAAVGLRWSPAAGMTGSLAGRYVGSRADGNDFAGDLYPELDAYTQWDLKLLWQRGPVQWSAGVNNLFDEVAAGSAYSSSVYPLPERSAFGGVAFTF